MINIPSFLVRTDSEKHINFALTHREMDEGSFIGKAIPDRAGSEKKIPDRRSPSEVIDQVV